MTFMSYSMCFRLKMEHIESISCYFNEIRASFAIQSAILVFVNMTVCLRIRIVELIPNLLYLNEIVPLLWPRSGWQWHCS